MKPVDEQRGRNPTQHLRGEVTHSGTGRLAFDGEERSQILGRVEEEIEAVRDGLDEHAEAAI
jgi:hypothetical protein